VEDENQKATPGAEVEPDRGRMIKEEPVVLFAAFAIAELFSYLGWLSYLRFIERAGPENFDAASKAAGAYPNHDNFVGRIIEAWANARRRRS
jgi:hypothetical protein